MIEARGLTKRYGDTLAVDNLSFSVAPGKITGFLGPNGAGKTTTMRHDPGPGPADVWPGHGRREAVPALAQPMREVGALLDAKALHGGRSAYNHLLCLAQSNNLPTKRVDEVLGLVGLSEVARKRAKGFSLGMGQRLGIAAALLGDPKILMFDEPVNGLDPEGILWIRNLMKALAAEGRTVFVSSHLMSEMENTADHLLVIGRGQADRRLHRRRVHRGQLPADSPGAHAAAGSAGKLVAAAGGTVRDDGDGVMVVTGLDVGEIGDLAYENSVRLHELAPLQASLEQAFMELTASSVQFHAGVPGEAALRLGRWPEMATTSTHRRTAAAPPRCLPGRAGRPLRGCLRSEFTKIRSVRSTYWTLARARSWSLSASGRCSASGRPRTCTACTALPSAGGIDASSTRSRSACSGCCIGQLIIVRARRADDHFRVLHRDDQDDAGERAAPRHCSSPPRRWCSRLSPSMTGLITCFASFFVGQAIMSSQHMNTTLGQPGVLRAVIGGGLFLTACGLLAFGIGRDAAAHRGCYQHRGRAAVRAVDPRSASCRRLAGPRRQVGPGHRRRRDLGGRAYPGTNRCSRRGPGSRCSAATRPSRSIAGMFLFRKRNA